MGLGAVPPRAGATEAQRRLAAAMRKERAGAEEDALSEGEEMESRAGLIGSARRGGKGSKRKRARKEAKEAAAAQEAAMAKEAKQAAAAKEAKEAKEAEEAGAAKEADEADEAAAAKAVAVARDGAAARPTQRTWTASWGVKKKRKVRSRQKNLRRDTRPASALPAHLTAETLLGGRVRPRAERSCSVDAAMRKAV